MEGRKDEWEERKKAEGKEGRRGRRKQTEEGTKGFFQNYQQSLPKEKQHSVVVSKELQGGGPLQPAVSNLSRRQTFRAGVPVWSQALKWSDGR